MFLVAGTWFPGVDRTGYVFLNDLVVGRSSALAVGGRGSTAPPAPPTGSFTRSATR